MGAYKPGEIRNMCEMVRPQIGIVTAINAAASGFIRNNRNDDEGKIRAHTGSDRKNIAIFNPITRHVEQMSHWAKKDRTNVSGIFQRKINKQTSFTGQADIKSGDLGISLHFRNQ